ncbi:MAG: amidohydrolase family protein [Bacteroidota bacterium]
MKNSRAKIVIMLLLFFFQILLTPKQKFHCGVAERMTSRLLVINNINIIPMTKNAVLKNKTVVIKDGTISEIRDEPVSTSFNSLIVDGSGRYLIPGLADMHVHISSRKDSELFVANGVTTVQNMWGTEGFLNFLGFPNQLNYKMQVNDETLTGPTIYTAGPVLEGRPKDHPFMQEITTWDKAKKTITNQVKQGYDFIKVYDHLSEEVYQSLIEECQRLDVMVKGHVPYEVGLEKTIRAGQRQIDHLTGFLDYDSVKLLVPEDSLRYYAAMARNNRVYNCPTIIFTQKRVLLGDFTEMAENHQEIRYLSFMQRFFLRQSIKALEDELKYQGNDYRKDVFDLYRKVIICLREQNAPLLAGTDTGNPFVFPGFSLHEELEQLVKAGLTPFEALACATVNPFESIDMLNEAGTIEPGKKADLVILRKNPLLDIKNTKEIESVILRGKLLNQDDLRRLLEY